jgi:hypothetical protein
MRVPGSRQPGGRMRARRAVARGGEHRRAVAAVARLNARPAGSDSALTPGLVNMAQITPNSRATR